MPRALALVWTAAKRWTIIWIVLLVLQGLIPMVSALLTRSAVNSVVTVLNSHGNMVVLGQQASLAVLLVVFLIVGQFLPSITSYVRTMQSELVQDHIYDLIHKQTIRLDLGFYETTEYYDQLYRATVDAMSRPTALLENLGTLVQNAITFAGLTAVLISYAWWLPVVLLLAAIPPTVVAVRGMLLFHQWRIQNTLNERKVRYYDYMLTAAESAAELRISASAICIGPYFGKFDFNCAVRGWRSPASR